MKQVSEPAEGSSTAALTETPDNDTPPSQPERAKPTYASYLLRLWRQSEASLWLASLESTLTRERLMFASMEELIAFLKAETDITRM
jgi:hypothetical protein